MEIQMSIEGMKKLREEYETVSLEDMKIVLKKGRSKVEIMFPDIVSDPFMGIVTGSKTNIERIKEVMGNYTPLTEDSIDKKIVGFPVSWFGTKQKYETFFEATKKFSTILWVGSRNTRPYEKLTLLVCDQPVDDNGDAHDTVMIPEYNLVMVSRSLGVEKISELVSGLKVKRVDNKDTVLTHQIKQFNSGLKIRKEEQESHREENLTNIAEYNERLMRQYTMVRERTEMINSLESAIKNNVPLFLEQIRLLEEMPFIKKVKLTEDSLNITFNGYFLKSEVDFSPEQNGESTELFDVFMDEITFHINGNGELKVTSRTPIKDSYAHPHANGRGVPCLGHGEGADNIRKLISEQKYSNAAYLLLMWLKTYRPEDCYIRPYVTVESTIENGLPVYHKGKLLGLENDFFDDLEKNSCYDKNRKKYGKVKPE